MLFSSTRKVNIIARFLIPYLVVLIIPLAIGTFVYYKTADTVEKEVVAANLSVLDQSKEIMDRRLAEIISIGQHLASDTKVQQFQFVREPYSGTNTYLAFGIRQGLYDYTLSNNFMFRYFVLFKNSNLAISPDMTYDLPNFYEQVLRYDSIDYSTWYDGFLQRFFQKSFLPSQNVTFLGKSYSMITFVQSLGYPQSIQGAIIGLIDNKEIQKLLRGVDVSSGGWAYIADEKGNMISYIGPDSADKIHPIDFDTRKGVHEEVIGSREMIITHTTSDYNNWTYVAGQPSEIVLQKVNYIKKITLSVLLASLLVGGVAAFVLAYRNSKPLRGLVNNIMEKFDIEAPTVSDAYSLIQSTLSRLEHDKDNLQAEMKAQLPFLTIAFFERLLNGQLAGEKEIEALSKHIGIEIKGRQYAIVILEICGYDDVAKAAVLEELDVKRYFAKNIMHNYFDGWAYAHDVGENQVAVLFFSPYESAADSKHQIHMILLQADKELRDQCNSQIVWGGGGIYQSFTNISRSYEEARQALHVQTQGTASVIQWYDELPRVSNCYFYPSDWQTRLMNLSRSGHIEEARKMLFELHHVNFKERNLSLTMLNLFISELWGTVAKLSEQMNGVGDSVISDQMTDMYKRLGDYKESEQLFCLLVASIEEICRLVNTRKKSNNQRLGQEIVSFLDENYSNSNMCLAMVAERFEMSEIYVSQFFKEQTGVNFSEYLENVRMERVRELLKQSHLTANDIAAQTGYHSFNTFSRAFKRIHGVSTSSYRKDHSSN